MNRKAYHTLEFYKIIERLASEAGSAGGRKRCMELTPMQDLAAITAAQQETEDALTRLYRRGGVGFSGTRDVRASLKRLEIGSTLNIPELLDICSLLETAARAKQYARQNEGREEDPDSLDPLFDALEPCTQLSGEIRRCILSEDEISDDASPALHHVRRSILAANDKIHSTLSGMVNGSARTYLQDAVITQRNGRYCIPVKAEYRSQVPGMIHDQSSTGSTLFVEPMAVVKLNNDLKELYLKEQEEIEHVLEALSNQTAFCTEELDQDYDILTTLDFIFAKAKLAKNMKATRPRFNEKRQIYIKEGRHPLLDPKKVVPVTIRLGQDFDLLIVTGPNTGGKTVSLKTTGLLTLMGQAGLHIPAAQNSELAVFDDVYADIGDEQSIEQSLSTFSAHMKNIVQILDEADRSSLILFDELGAGTDPVEGAALAIAVIEQARSQGAKIAATTHYAELKTYAMTSAGVENASCEFDVETLCPTYKLLIGIPGKSNAFAISARLGLDPRVIETAKQQMDAESIRFEDVLTQLEIKRQQLEKEKEEIDRLHAKQEEDSRRAREFRAQMERAKENARSRGEAEAKRILADAKSAADAAFRELDELRKAQKKQLDAQAMNEKRVEIVSELNAARERAGVRDESREPIPAPSRPIRAGDLVEIPGTNRPAEVTAVKGDRLVLKAGVLSMTVKNDEVRLIEDDERAAMKKPSVPASPTRRILNTAAAARELDLRGMETLEAESVLENYLDAARRAHLETVTIIHGKGTGALRKAVQSYLRRDKTVRSFRLGNYGEGESGVTVVELK